MSNPAPASRFRAPAVLSPLDDHMGLDIARALAVRGIPVYGINSDRTAPGRFSNACRFVPSPVTADDREEDAVDFLVRFGRGLGRRAVFYPLCDRQVLLFSRYREALGEIYDCVMPPHETILRLTTKDGLASLAEEGAFPAPRTVSVAGADELDRAAAVIPFPAIIKPAESLDWHRPGVVRLLSSGLLEGRAKVVRCRDPKELRAAYGRLAPLAPRMIVQEVIPGEDGRLVYASFYLDRASRLLAYFAGRKHRVLPTGFGSASYVRSYTDPDLESSVRRILAAVRYRGLGGLEFKRDPRDETYKLIECNARFGMWDGLGARCGVDLAFTAYRDALGLPVEPATEFRRDVIWVDWQRDLRAGWRYRRQGVLTFNQWRRSLRGPKMSAIFSRRDWRPGIAFTVKLAGLALAKVGRAIGLPGRGRGESHP